MPKKDFIESVEQKIQIVEAPEAPKFKFNFIFQVINPFLNYQKGALIKSDDAIQVVIDNGYAINCNRLPRR